MAKRRTRKDKKNAKRSIKVSWQPSNNTSSNHKSVKGQSRNSPVRTQKTKTDKKNPNSTAKDEKAAWIKKDILKSIGLAGLILGLELVIYFVL